MLELLSPQSGNVRFALGVGRVCHLQFLFLYDSLRLQPRHSSLPQDLLDARHRFFHLASELFRTTRTCITRCPWAKYSLNRLASCLWLSSLLRSFRQLHHKLCRSSNDFARSSVAVQALPVTVSVSVQLHPFPESKKADRSWTAVVCEKRVKLDVEKLRLRHSDHAAQDAVGRDDLAMFCTRETAGKSRCMWDKVCWQKRTFRPQIKCRWKF